jgi:hypothetical protein
LDCDHRGRFLANAPDSARTLLSSVEMSRGVVMFLESRASALSGDLIELASGSVSDAGWEGVALDTSIVRAFAPLYPNTAELVRAGLNLVGRVPLDSVSTAYLLRAPGMYENSALDLWPYSSQLNRFTAPVCVAEAWGDAGDAFDLRSWLVDLDRDGIRELIQLRFTSYLDIEADSGTKPDEAAVLMTWRWQDSRFVRDSTLEIAARAAIRARVPTHVLPN